MSLRLAGLIGIVLMAMALRACEFVDPLYVSENGRRGTRLIDAVAGWREDSRIICVQPVASRASCSPRSADVLVTGLQHFGQLQARWSPEDPDSVEVLLFGGEVIRCLPRVRAGTVRIALRQLPTLQMPSPDGWSPDTTPEMFEGLRNRCTASG